ncbi:phage baseplate plug family protein [Hydrogenophaga pseudoflava]|uniref:phage baseplate plug family protein n=1 Tax=Hydrogenophaga pseudoflava TaxID=47421 RepID=UPI0027E3CD93|nr:hypothetical protein [Hydrogenophaga pseudoflava]MDQ7745452.1 hypothetical protein [Hydrogenophaga pseudoflava]
MIVSLPLTSDPAQSFTVQLGRSKYLFDVKFNSRSGVWTFDLFDAATKVAMLASIPIALGVDMLWPYNLGIGRLIAGDSSNRGRDAGSDDLGQRLKVFWFSPEEG